MKFVTFTAIATIITMANVNAAPQPVAIPDLFKRDCIAYNEPCEWKDDGGKLVTWPCCLGAKCNVPKGKQHKTTKVKKEWLVCGKPMRVMTPPPWEKTGAQVPSTKGAGASSSNKKKQGTGKGN